MWYSIDHEKVNVWHPVIFIGNSVEAQSIISFGKDAYAINSLWYFYPEHKIRYSTVLTTKISCKMNFKNFPLDSHECILDLKNWISTSYRLSLCSPKIYTDDKNGKEIGGKEFKMRKNGRLDYNFHFETLPSSVYEDGG